MAILNPVLGPIRRAARQKPQVAAKMLILGVLRYARDFFYARDQPVDAGAQLLDSRVPGICASADLLRSEVQAAAPAPVVRDLSQALSLLVQRVDEPQCGSPKFGEHELRDRQLKFSVLGEAQKKLGASAVAPQPDVDQYVRVECDESGRHEAFDSSPSGGAAALGE